MREGRESVMWRRRVPEECSAEAVQLYQRCISRKPADRPDIATVLQVLNDELKPAPT